MDTAIPKHNFYIHRRILMLAGNGNYNSSSVAGAGPEVFDAVPEGVRSRARCHLDIHNSGFTQHIPGDINNE